MEPTGVQPPSILSGTKTLLLGAPGSGKTWSLTTLIEAGLELFVLITDPGGEESLLDAMRRKNLPIDKLHWRYVPAASPSWRTLGIMAQQIGSMGYEGLTKIKTGIEKQDYQQFMQVLHVCSNFNCVRTGLEYGPIDSWGPDRVFALDSNSGLSTMCLDMMIGAKPAAHMGEYGVGMNAQQKLIQKFCSDLHCFFVLTAHLDRSYDEIRGKPQLMVSALGSKLAPKLPKDFSDVILAYREGTEYFWSTAALDVDLKARTLPLDDKLSPDFGQIVVEWRERARLAATETSTNEEHANG